MPFVKWRKFMTGYGKGRAAFSGSFAADTAGRATSTAVETTIGSITIPAKTLYRNGYGLRVTVIGTFAATAGAKTLKLKFGTATLITYASTTVNGVDWRIDADIFRTGVGAQWSSVEAWNETNKNEVLLIAAQTQNELIDNDIVVTGTGATGSDIITCRVLSVEALSQ